MTRKQLKEQFPWIQNVISHVEHVKMVESAEVDVQFYLHQELPGENECTIVVEGGQIQYQHVPFEQWHLEMKWADNQLSIPKAVLKQKDHQLSAAGEWSSTNQMSKLHVYNDIEPDQLLKMVPEEWGLKVQNWAVTCEGGLKVETWFGPAPMAQLFDAASGWVSGSQINAKGIWLERCFAKFEKQPDGFSITKIDAVVGKDHQQGPLRGHLSCNRKTKEVEGVVESGFDPSILLPIITQTKFGLNYLPFPFLIKRHRISVLDFSFTLGDTNSLVLKGPLHARDFIYKGVEVDSFSSTLIVSNRNIYLEDFVAQQKGGAVTGRIVKDKQDRTMKINLVSTADPYAASKVLSPSLKKLIHRFRFEGPVFAKLDGQVSYEKEGTNSNLFVEFFGQHCGYKDLLAETCSLDVTIQDKVILVRNVHGNIYGGNFVGHMDILEEGWRTNRRYEASVEVAGVDFGQLVRSLRGHDPEKPYGGQLEGRLVQVSGFLGEGRGDTARGDGFVAD